jgi:hypothetical protein
LIENLSKNKKNCGTENKIELKKIILSVGIRVWRRHREDCGSRPTWKKEIMGPFLQNN